MVADAHSDPSNNESIVDTIIVTNRKGEILEWDERAEVSVSSIRLTIVITTSKTTMSKNTANGLFSFQKLWSSRKTFEHHFQ